MKKLFLLLFTLLAFTASALATDVQIGASTIPGFNAANLPPDVTVTPVSVINGSPTVTCSNCFRQQWVGLGGFRIQINGVTYTVAYVSSRSSLTLTANYAASDSPSATILWYKYVELRVYADSAFQPLGKTYIVQPGAPGTGAWHRRVAASVVNELGTNNLYIPQLTLDATTDSLTNQAARYTAAFYRPEGALLQFYDCFDSFSLPPTGATTWPDICMFNTRQVIVQDDSTFTKDQINAMRTGCTTGQSLFYAVTGLKPSCLNIGTGLQITGDTLSATAGSSYQTILNNGTPLTQRATLNFLAPSFIASDNAGASRTEVTADSDLNALASNATNGFWVRTGAGAGAARLFQAPAAGFTITNNDGVAGNPTFVLANDLAGLEGLAGTGGAYRTAADTWANRTLQQPAAGITITNPAGVAGDPTFVLANDLNAVEGLSTTGIATRTAADTWTTRAITGTTAQVTLTNGSGVGGDPTVSLPTTVFLGTAGGSPAAGTLKGPDASGTNIAGANLQIAGGPGTGNAAPGLSVLKYPLAVASGTTLQSLSANSYPINANLWTQVVDGTAVTGTTTETTIIGTVNGTKTVEAGFTQVGRVFHLSMNGQFTTSGASSLTIRIKAGSTTLGTITVGTLGNIGQRRWDLDVQILIRTTGATATWAIAATFIYSTAAGAGAAVSQTTTGGTATVDSTAAQALDITAQWGTADASSISSTFSAVTISR